MIESNLFTSRSGHKENDRERLVPLQLGDVGLLHKDVDQRQVVPRVQVQLVVEHRAVTGVAAEAAWRRSSRISRKREKGEIFILTTRRRHLTLKLIFVESLEG